MTNLIAMITGVYIVFVGGLYLLQRNLMYHPDHAVPSPAASGAPEMMAVTFSTGDGLALVAWYRPPARGALSIVYFHGNAGHIGYRASKARPYLDAGLGLLLVGYRGYGGNPGSPTEAGLYADGRAALAFLAEQGVPPHMTALYGESLGCGVAVQMARETAGSEPVAAVVLESPFTGVGDIAATHYPFVPARWLVKDRFDSVEKIADIRAPVLIIHGEKDRVVPVRFGRRLFEAAAEPKESRWFRDAGHNNLYDFGAAETVNAFLRKVLRRRSDPEGRSNPPEN